ncbi:MAG: class III poly(R)-hydroxyalkanoic acid synthase subunit PhaE [Gammaproteobacteria bacterium]|jgi:class III poly(R)-hydroxyalkanoic acid synthase PhaE subunit
MAEMKDAAEAWTKVWRDAQKQYLDAWMRLSGEGREWPGARAPFDWGGAAPWSEPLQQWSRLMTQALPPDSRDISTRLFDLGKSYLSMGETFWHLLQQGQGLTGSATDWQEALKNALSAAGGLNLTREACADPWSGLATFWGLPLNTWQRFACSLSPFPGEMEKALRPESVAQPSEMTKVMRQFLSLPPVGYTREWQEQAQEWVQHYMDYARALQDFMRLLGTVGQRATELFSERLAAQFREGASLEGLRAAYNLWIDCGEEAYAEVVATPEFPHLQAQMVNSLMRLKRQEQEMVNEVMTALNMPTRQEMDTSHKRVYELQRQLSALQDIVEDLTLPEEPPEEPRVAREPPRARPVKRKAPAGKKAAARKPAAAKRRVQPKTKKG